MARLASIPCAACGASVKRAGRWAGCPACHRAVEAYLERTVDMRDPNAWVRAHSAAHGDRERFIEIVRAARAA